MPYTTFHKLGKGLGDLLEIDMMLKDFGGNASKTRAQLISNWWLEVRPYLLLSLSLTIKEHTICSWAVTGSTQIVASLQRCTNALSNGKEITLKWFRLTCLWVWQQLIQHIGSLKTAIASLVESRKEASSRSMMGINSRSNQSALRVCFNDSSGRLLQIG